MYIILIAVRVLFFFFPTRRTNAFLRRPKCLFSAQTLKSSHTLDLSINIPLSSKSTPSSRSRSSFLFVLIPLGADFQSPWKPPMY